MKNILNCEPVNYHGYAKYQFDFEDTKATIVVPNNPRDDRKWIWKALYFDAFPKFELEMLSREYYLAHIKSKTLFPAPASTATFDKFYCYVTNTLALAKKPAMFGLSRGAYYTYTWVKNNTDKVCCIYGDNPVCDIRSVYKNGKTEDMKNKWIRLLEEFGYENEDEFFKYHTRGPIDDLEPLAKNGIPIVHVVAVDDKSVPYEENTKQLAEKYKSLDGTIKVIEHPGGHHPHGLEDPTPVINFIENYLRR